MLMTNVSIYFGIVGQQLCGLECVYLVLVAAVVVLRGPISDRSDPFAQIR